MEGREEEPRIVADTNIIISALLKDNSINSYLIKSRLFYIYFPDYGLKEIEKYRSYIKAKRIRNSQKVSLEFSEKYIFEEIKVAPLDLYRQKIKEAFEIMREIDIFSMAMASPSDFLASTYAGAPLRGGRRRCMTVEGAGIRAAR